MADGLDEAEAALRAHGRAMRAVYVLGAAALASGIGMAITVVLGGSYVGRWLIGLGAIGCGAVASVIALRARRLRQALE